MQIKILTHLNNAFFSTFLAAFSLLTSLQDKDVTSNTRSKAFPLARLSKLLY